MLNYQRVWEKYGKVIIDFFEPYFPTTSTTFPLLSHYFPSFLSQENPEEFGKSWHTMRKLSHKNDDPTNNVLLVQIEGPVWYTIYNHLPVVKGVSSNPSINQPFNGKRTSMDPTVIPRKSRETSTGLTSASSRQWYRLVAAIVTTTGAPARGDQNGTEHRGPKDGT